MCVKKLLKLMHQSRERKLEMNFIQDFCKFYNAIDINTGGNNIPDKIFHYTSSAGAKGIFENSTLRFTERCFLNDASEGQYVLDLCKDNIDILLPEDTKFKSAFLKQLDEKYDLIRKDQFRVFQCSFCGNPDSLCMWNYYTKSNGVKGYNFGFGTSQLIDGISVEPEYEDKKPEVKFGKVIYSKAEQLEIVKNLLEQFIDFDKKYDGKFSFVASYAVRKLLQQGAFFKKECFAVEDEYRLVITLFLNGKEFVGVKNEINYMERHDIFIPYVDIVFKPEALECITISPTLDDVNTRLSLQMISQKKFAHLTEDDIKSSDIPVRY